MEIAKCSGGDRELFGTGRVLRSCQKFGVHFPLSLRDRVLSNKVICHQLNITKFQEIGVHVRGDRQHAAV